jgi:C-terminal processing protease CtpA/Prc
MYSFDGEVFIDDIIKGSPADKSGLQNGDVIMSINNNFSGDLEAYKNLLQKTAGKADMLIMRNGSLKIITLKIGRIR